jgi:sorbitol-specific phosphotransferase system component IIC
MTQDWLLTLLAITPFLLVATIVVLAAILKLIQNERIRRASETSAPLRQSGSAGGSD